MSEIKAHKASVGETSVDRKVLRTLGRIARLQDALVSAADDRKESLQAEIDALDATFGGRRVREAMQTALAAELEATRPEREAKARAARRAQLEKELAELSAEDAGGSESK